MHVVEAVDLTKVYHNRYIALNALDLNVDKAPPYALRGSHRCDVHIGSRVKSVRNDACGMGFVWNIVHEWLCGVSSLWLASSGVRGASHGAQRCWARVGWLGRHTRQAMARC